MVDSVARTKLSASEVCYMYFNFNIILTQKFRSSMNKVNCALPFWRATGSHLPNKFQLKVFLVSFDLLTCISKLLFILLFFSIHVTIRTKFVIVQTTVEIIKTEKGLFLHKTTVIGTF